jgi:hypothetical protein
MKHLFLLLAVVFSTLYSSAQNSSIGFDFGPSSNGFQGKHPLKSFKSFDPLHGFNAGIQIRIKRHDSLAFKTGVYYEQKGAICVNPNYQNYSLGVMDTEDWLSWSFNYNISLCRYR